MRQGVGSAMLAVVETQARAWNIGKLHLHSPASAAGFFARLGFADGGKEKACYGLECDLYWEAPRRRAGRLPGRCARPFLQLQGVVKTPIHRMYL